MAKKLKCFAWTILKSFVPSHRWIVVHLCEPCEPLMALCYIFDAKTGWHVNEGTFASLFNSIYLRSCGTRRLVDWLIWSPMTASTIALDQFFPCPWGPGGWLWGWRGLQVTVSFSVSWWPQLASSPLWISFDCVFACKRPTSNPPREFATNRCNLAECVFLCRTCRSDWLWSFFLCRCTPCSRECDDRKARTWCPKTRGRSCKPAWTCLELLQNDDLDGCAKYAQATQVMKFGISTSPGSLQIAITPCHHMFANMACHRECMNMRIYLCIYSIYKLHICYLNPSSQETPNRESFTLRVSPWEFHSHRFRKRKRLRCSAGNQSTP